MKETSPKKLSKRALKKAPKLEHSLRPHIAATLNLRKYPAFFKPSKMRSKKGRHTLLSFRHKSVGSKTSFWDNAVIYQIYPRSFYEKRAEHTDYRGEGNLLGIIEKLDYIKSLSIDVIWLSPFYPSPMVDSGYDVSDYCDVDPRYGTLADFDALVRAADSRKIKIMIDFVPNHTSDQHDWFKESASSKNNPKSDWYIWRDAKPDGSPPNNWASVFSLPQLERRKKGELDLPDTALTPPLSAW